MTCLVVKLPFYKVIDLMTTFPLLAKSQKVHGNNILGLPALSTTSSSRSQNDHQRGSLN